MGKTQSGQATLKRGRGRPAGGAGPVGRAALIAAACRVLEDVPPARATMAMVAREAGADPGLVRYYFGDRQSLLLAVVEEMLSTGRAREVKPGAGPAEQLAGRLRGAADFARTAQSMQRLMIDELLEGGSPKIRERMRQINTEGIASYAPILDQDNPDALEPVDPLMLHIAVIGLGEFFAAAQPLIRLIAPERDPAALAEAYKDFIVKLVLDGVRPR